MFEQILERISLALDDLRIPYLVIGGQAVLLYGEPRLTRDIDITLDAGPDRLPAIMGLIQGWGWTILTSAPAEFVERTMVLPCLEPASGVRVDFIFSFSAFENQAMEHARRVVLGKAEVRFASVEDLIIHKIVAGRLRDLEDVKGILLRGSAINLSYLDHWLGEFDRSLGGQILRRWQELRKLVVPAPGK